MTSKDSGQYEDKELLDRYRHASDTEPSAPSDAVRAAILAESRRVAAQLAQRNPPQSFDTSRPAANDSRWKIAAFGTLGAAVLGALLIAPRYWQTLPARDVAGAQLAARDFAPPASPPIASSPPPASAPAPVQLAAPRAKLEYSAPQAAAAGRARIAPPPAGLQSAAAAGDLVQATALLEQGAAVDARDAQGCTPLMLAVAQGRLEMVRFLLQRGANPNIADNSGKTPLQSATDQGRQDILALLQNAGARQ